MASTFKMTWWRDHPGEEGLPLESKTMAVIGGGGGELWEVIERQFAIVGDESLGHEAVMRIEIERVNPPVPVPSTQD